MLNNKGKKLFGTFALIGVLAIGGVLVGGNNQPVEASETGNVSISFSFAEIKELLSMFLSGDDSGLTGIGSSGSRYQNGLSADNTSPSAGEVRGTTFTSTGAVTFGGAATLSGTLSVSGATTLDELTQGGSVLATSTTGTATILATSDLLTYSTWEVTPNTADLTYTFPASSTMATLVPSAGDFREWTIINATSTAAIDVIFAAGTGSAIKGSCGGGLTLDEASHGTLRIARKANSDLVINTCFPTAD